MKQLYEIVHRIEGVEVEERDVTNYMSKEDASKILLQFKEQDCYYKDITDQVYEDGLLVSYSYNIGEERHTLYLK